jgi:hypothetical protein
MEAFVRLICVDEVRVDGDTDLEDGVDPSLLAQLSGMLGHSVEKGS